MSKTKWPRGNTATKTVAKPLLENADVIRALQLNGLGADMTLEEVSNLTETLNHFIERKP